MNEITPVPQDEAQKKSVEIPEGMMLYPATFGYQSYDPVNVDSEEYDYYSGAAYILLPQTAMDYVVVPDGDMVSVIGVEEISVKTSYTTVCWTVSAGGVTIHDKRDFYDGFAEDDQTTVEPQWYEGPDGILTPFAVGLSPEQAIAAYNAVHADVSKDATPCDICVQVGGYCGHS